MNDDELPTAAESFKIGWKELLQGKTRPIAEIWDGIDIDDGE